MKIIKDTNNLGKLEDLFKQVITSPIVDIESLSYKVKDINRQLENL